MAKFATKIKKLAAFFTPKLFEIWLEKIRQRPRSSQLVKVPKNVSLLRSF
jgi:hypothetical protein